MAKARTIISMCLGTVPTQICWSSPTGSKTILCHPKGKELKIREMVNAFNSTLGLKHSLFQKIDKIYHEKKHTTEETALPLSLMIGKCGSADILQLGLDRKETVDGL